MMLGVLEAPGPTGIAGAIAALMLYEYDVGGVRQYVGTRTEAIAYGGGAALAVHLVMSQ